MPILRLDHCLQLLALWVFRCRPHHWLSLCVCRSFLGRRSCVFFLSSCSAWGRLLLGLFLIWLLCLFLRRVLPQVTLSCLSCSCSGAMFVGFAVSLEHRLVFYLVRALPPGPAVGTACPATGCPWGFLPFLTQSACPTAELVA